MSARRDKEAAARIRQLNDSGSFPVSKMLVLAFVAAIAAISGGCLAFNMVRSNNNESAAVKSVEEKTVPSSSPAKGTTPLDEFLTALSQTANVDLSNLDIVTDFGRRPQFAGQHIFSKRNIKQGATVLSLPSSLQFNFNTIDPVLLRGLIALLPQLSTEAQELWRDGFLEPLPVLYSLLLQRLNEKKSRWWPWIKVLPPVSHVAQHHGIFMHDEEVENCLTTRGQEIHRRWDVELSYYKNVTGALCRSVVSPPPSGDSEAKKTMIPQEIVQKLMCHLSSSDLDWAYGVVSSRSLRFLGGNTTLFPLVDFLPYEVAATIRPGNVEATDDGAAVFVHFQAARNIEKGDILSFRTDLKETIEATMRQGYFDSDFFAEGFGLPVVWKDAECNSKGLPARTLFSNGSLSHLTVECASKQILILETNTKEKRRVTEVSEADVNRFVLGVVVKELEAVARVLDRCDRKSRPLMDELVNHYEFEAVVLKRFVKSVE